MRRKGPATQQHRCLHTCLHCTPCDLHQYCPRSACAPQTKLAMKHEKEVNWESGKLFCKEKHSVNSGKTAEFHQLSSPLLSHPQNISWTAPSQWYSTMPWHPKFLVKTFAPGKCRQWQPQDLKMSHGLTLTRTERQILKTLSNLTQLFSQISRDNVPRQQLLEGSVMCSKHATFKLIRRPQDGADKTNSTTVKTSWHLEQMQNKRWNLSMRSLWFVHCEFTTQMTSRQWHCISI